MLKKVVNRWILNLVNGLITQRDFLFFLFLELSNTKVILSKIITHMFINVKPDLHFVQYMFER